MTTSFKQPDQPAEIGPVLHMSPRSNRKNPAARRIPLPLRRVLIVDFRDDVYAYLRSEFRHLNVRVARSVGRRGIPCRVPVCAATRVGQRPHAGRIRLAYLCQESALSRRLPSLGLCASHSTLPERSERSDAGRCCDRIWRRLVSLDRSSPLGSEAMRSVTGECANRTTTSRLLSVRCGGRRVRRVTAVAYLGRTAACRVRSMRISQEVVRCSD